MQASSRTPRSTHCCLLRLNEIALFIYRKIVNFHLQQKFQLRFTSGLFFFVALRDARLCFLLNCSQRGIPACTWADAPPGARRTHRRQPLGRLPREDTPFPADGSDSGGYASYWNVFLFFFFFKFWWTHVLLWDRWYPCFRILVMSLLHFKTRVGGLICTWWSTLWPFAIFPHAYFNRRLHFYIFVQVCGNTVVTNSP